MMVPLSLEPHLILNLFSSTPDRLRIGTPTGSSNSTPSITFFDDGNVGIGRVNPGYQLDVEGTIRACEVKVESNSWCDYVFAPDYNLMPLEDVEQYVKNNRHLPGMPSEEEVTSGDLRLGDMQRKQMEKIEELTLYIIELQNQLERLRSENEELRGVKEDVQALKAKVDEMTK